MTSLYFVRHAEPVHSWEDDRTRPLTEEGLDDSKKVTNFFENLHIDAFFSSPYKRSVDTILGAATAHGMTIKTDERLRERQAGKGSNNFEMMRKRWADFSFCELGGENLLSVQNRNMQAAKQFLNEYADKCVVIGTHGTALSTILNNYDSTYNCNSFLRMIDFMPYIIRLAFDGDKLIEKEEILIIKKNFRAK